MNYLTLDAHKDESIHSGATFSTPVFFTPAFSSRACFFHSRVFHSRVFSRPVLSVLQHASERSVTMNYDAEQFNIQPAIDTLVLDSMRRFNHTSPAVLHTYQCYLKVC